MGQPLFRIFVSSTYIDLIQYRKAAEKAINDLRQKYEGMEYMGARPEEPLSACLQEIEDCDLMIGIYACHYGHIPDGSEFSITEQEYHHAVKCGKPCLCYFVDEDYDWPLKMNKDTDRARAALTAFKAKIAKAHVKAPFEEPLRLENNILGDLGAWLAHNRPQFRKSDIKPGQDAGKIYREAISEKYKTLSMIGFNRSFDMEHIYIPLTVHADAAAHISGREDSMAGKMGRSLKAEDLLDLPKKVAVVLGAMLLT